jgi:Smg protein
MESTVFDILVYVFDRYMQEELPDGTERESIERDLHSVGFGPESVTRALDWLADLAEVRERAGLATNSSAFRVYTDAEQKRLDAACRGLLLSLERGGVFTAGQREIVIERLLALESDELAVEHVKWVVLMVLSSHPAQAVDATVELLALPATVAVPN